MIYSNSVRHTVEDQMHNAIQERGEGEGGGKEAHAPPNGEMATTNFYYVTLVHWRLTASY